MAYRVLVALLLAAAAQAHYAKPGLGYAQKGGYGYGGRYPGGAGGGGCTSGNCGPSYHGVQHHPARGAVVEPGVVGAVEYVQPVGLVEDAPLLVAEPAGAVLVDDYVNGYPPNYDCDYPLY